MNGIIFLVGIFLFLQLIILFITKQWGGLLLFLFVLYLILHSG